MSPQIIIGIIINLFYVDKAVKMFYKNNQKILTTPHVLY